MQQNYKIAGLNVQMETWGRTVDRAIPYTSLTPENPDIVVTSEFEMVKKLYPVLSDDSCEYLGSGYSFYKQLVNFDGMMLHASAVVVDGKAYLFTAPCGTGKSTHTSNWRCILGDERVRMLNDDKPALRLIDGVWYAYGTPWCGKTGQNLNIRAPLAGIARISQAAENSIRPMDPKAAIELVFRQTKMPDDAIGRVKLMQLADQLICQIPFWDLQCTKWPESAIVSYEAMTGKSTNKCI